MYFFYYCYCFQFKTKRKLKAHFYCRAVRTNTYNILQLKRFALYLNVNLKSQNSHSNYFNIIKFKNTGHHVFTCGKIYYNNFPRLPLINTVFLFTFQENVGFITFYTGQNTKSRVHMVLVRCNKASSRKRNLKQQLIQPIDGGVSLIMI